MPTDSYHQYYHYYPKDGKVSKNTDVYTGMRTFGMTRDHFIDLVRNPFRYSQQDLAFILLARMLPDVAMSWVLVGE